MSVELNHTIIPTKDKWVSAKFLADILNLEAGPEWGHFVPVKTANGVTLDFDTREEFRPGHYAFLVSDAEFDAAFARIRAQGVRYYADPRRTKPGEINHLHGGRGVYFEDPNGHVMEIITHPYGDRPEQICSAARRRPRAVALLQTADIASRLMRGGELHREAEAAG